MHSTLFYHVYCDSSGSTPNTLMNHQYARVNQMTGHHTGKF